MYLSMVNTTTAPFDNRAFAPYGDYMSKDELTRTLADGLGVTANDSTPKFIEAIAIALGFSHDDNDNLLKQANRIATALERIADALEEQLR